MLPERDDDFGAVGIDVVGRQGVGAGRRPACPVRTDDVVSLVEGSQAVPAMSGIVVEMPIDFLGLQRLMEPLQQTELGRGAIADPDMAEVAGDMSAKAFGEEGRAVVGDQER